MSTEPIGDRIAYLSVPQSLRRDYGDFVVDPSIPIPVELPAGAVQLDTENLSWEMIISGMIKVVAREPDGEDADYYRKFVLAVKPDIMGEFSEAAILKSRNGDYRMALEILHALRGLFPDSCAVLLNEALVLEEEADSFERAGREDDFEEATEAAFTAWKYILSTDNPLPDVYFNAGFFFMKHGNFAKAKECFSDYLSTGEDPRKRSKASAIVKEIDSRELDDSVFKEAFDYIRLGEEDKGILKARDFLERHPGVWNGWFVLGWGLRRLERWADACAAFRKAAELGGTGADIYNELAICQMELGELTEARKSLTIALREEPENIKVMSNLGMVALRSGHKDEAESFFRTVLEFEPGDPVVRNYLESAGTL